MFAPASAVGGPVLTTETSATLPMEVDADPLLLPAVGSATLCETLALLVMLPSVPALICRTTLVLAPPASVPMEQAIGVVMHAPTLLMETTVALVRVSLKATLLAGLAPRLTMVKVSV